MRALILLLFAFFLSITNVASEETVSSGVNPAADSVFNFPSLSAVTPQATQLSSELERLKSTLNEDRQLGPLKEAQQQLQADADQLKDVIEAAGPITDIGTTRANLFRGQALGLLSRAERQATVLESRLDRLSQTQQNWQQKRSYWDQWQQSVTATQPELSLPGFPLAQQTLKEALVLLRPPIQTLSQLQEANSLLRFEVEGWLGQLEARLGFRPGDLVQRREVPLTSPAFWQQLTREMWADAVQQARGALKLNPNFLAEKGWLLFLQLVLALILARLISRYRKREGDKADWEFLTHHPWSSGGLISLAALSALYTNPSPLWQLILWALAAILGTRLASTLLQNRCKTTLVLVIAVLALSVRTLDFLLLPEPIYRLFLVVLSLGTFPLLWMILFRYHRTAERTPDLFTRLLNFGIFLNGISLISQIGGYQAVGTLLLRATLQSLLIGLMALMLLRLLRGAIELGTERAFFERSRFFRRFGEELASRLNTLVLWIVGGLALFSLLPIWGLADRPALAWEKMMAFGFTLGGIELTLGTLVSIVVAFFLAAQFSWLVQSLLETEAFYRTPVERGVRDAFKRLCHYAVMLIGFLVAMNLAGIEMKHFAVIAGAFGIGIGFGLQNIVNNFVSGLILLFERPVKVGDMVVVDGEFGSILKIGLRSTVIETWNRSEVIVPNSQLVSEKVTNWTLTNASARIELPVGVSYGSDVDLVTDVLHEVAEAHPDVLSDPKPSAVFVGFGDSALDFNLRFWIRDAYDQIRIRSDVGKAITRSFRDKQIEIPFPQRDLHLRSAAPGLMSENPENS